MALPAGAMDQSVALQHAGKPLSMVPVGLKEAALDSPTFRATAVHFSDQVEVIERWLEGYVKSISKLVHEVSSLEEAFNAFLQRAVPPSAVSEAVLDHDYTLLAMRRLGEGSREWWSQSLIGMKKMDVHIAEPIKAFMFGELRNFKDARKYLEQTQKLYDSTLARFVGQSKTKEPSALREDAFQVHETRKAYLKASLDFCLLAPQLRYTLDKLLVKVSFDQWREMKRTREDTNGSFAKWGTEMDRVRGWSKEMEAGESVFRRELQLARRDIATSAAQAVQPSRELEDYAISTVAFLGSKGPTTMNLAPPGKDKENAEKQGWLFLRTIYGKPARALWSRRWFYVKNGIFGWLVQGAQSGGVEESEKIGVLLCNIKPAVQEDRRFCFEVKTKNQTILLQAENQAQLVEWLATFELAKKKALEASATTDYGRPGSVDPAFAITQPNIPEFAAKSLDHGNDDQASSTERSGGLPVPDATFGTRASIDVVSPRRSATTREDGESGRDHASRLMQKLDLHRRSPNVQSDSLSSSAPVAPGGIASLISASHNILPVYSNAPLTNISSTNLSKTSLLPQAGGPEIQLSTLAPSTLAHPPAPTNLSKSAVIVSGERGISIAHSQGTGGMPSGIMANLWGSHNWGFVNRLEQASDTVPDQSLSSTPGTNFMTPTQTRDTSPNNDTTHRKAVSVDVEASRLSSQFATKPEVFPSNYPLALKTQEAQFRMLFPDVPRSDKVLLVFRATWNPNDQQDFPGRIYVTQEELYFYSHHLGLVLISGVRMDSIAEVTAAPGKDCDFIFLHLAEGISSAGYTRLTIKTFLEPLRLLQARLNFLIDAAHAKEQMSLEDIMTTLIRMEKESISRSPSMESWEDVSVNTPIDDGTPEGRRRRLARHQLHAEKGLHAGRSRKEATKFQLPTQPIIYHPPGMQRKVMERQFDVSPKALFHVLFGDKSAVFQLLYHERRANRIAQGPWMNQEGDHLRRDFNFQIEYIDMFRRVQQADVVDHQIIDVCNEHICYVVTDMKTPWHLPYAQDFMLMTRIVITHVEKSKCNLAIYTNVEWSKSPAFSRRLIERQALDDARNDAMDLTDVVADQVRKLGVHSRTKKAIRIFGHIGQQTTVSMFEAAPTKQRGGTPIKPRTLTTLLIDTLASFAESCISSVMMWAFAIMRSVWKVTSVDRVIMGLLLASLMTNVVFTTRGTTTWWTERNAVRFMGRMGIGPDTSMSKAIYIRDLEEAVQSVAPDVVGQSHNACLQQFQHLTNLTNLDAPRGAFSHTYRATSPSARSSAVRLQRARQNFGSYRHDLTVAMRMLNRIERELLQAEWETWLGDENKRCQQVRRLLDGGVAGSSSVPQSQPKGTRGGTPVELRDEGGPGQSPWSERDVNDEELRSWWDEYCGSCQRAQEHLLKGPEGRPRFD